MPTLSTVDVFVKALPYRHRGIANFKLWLTGVVDTWSRVNPVVVDCMAGGEAYIGLLSKEEHSEVQRYFQQGVSKSADKGYFSDETGFVSITLKTCQEYNDKNTTHTLNQRARVWEYLIELRKNGELNEAYRVAGLERLLIEEWYCIERFLN